MIVLLRAKCIKQLEVLCKYTAFHFFLTLMGAIQGELFDKKFALVFFYQIPSSVNVKFDHLALYYKNLPCRLVTLRTGSRDLQVAEHPLWKRFHSVVYYHFFFQAVTNLLHAYPAIINLGDPLSLVEREQDARCKSTFHKKKKTWNHTELESAGRGGH